MPIRVRARGLLPDLAAALLLGILGLSSLAAGSGDRPADLLGALLVVLGSGCLVLTRRHPIGVLAVALGTSLLVEVLGYAQEGGGLTALWALYAVALLRPLRVGLTAALLTAGVVVTVIALAPGGASTASLISSATTVAGAWALGRGARSRRSRRLAEDRAALAEERARIAREMQDLMAHELAELTVQVTAARRVVGADPGAADGLLAGAEDTARAVVAEARRILDLLSPGDRPPDLAPDRSPLPGLADLPSLVRRHVEGGLDVDLATTLPSDVGSGPSLLAYRTVEETLAEARQARARTAEVSVAGAADGLCVRVRHDGGAGAGPVPTRTLGLARRAQLYGGTVDRRVDEDGTTVVLQIPAAGTRRTTT